MTTVIEWYRSGGLMMLPLLVVAIAGALLLGERIAFVVKRSRVNARPFIEHVLSLTRSGQYDEAVALCAAHHAALPDLGLVILRSRASDAAVLQEVARAAWMSFVPSLRRRLGWLIALAVAALLLGVAGAAVNISAVMSGTDGATVPLAHALDYAMRPVTTAALTALPLVIGYAALAQLARTMTDQLEEFSIRLINTLAGRPDVRLGHREAGVVNPLY